MKRSWLGIETFEVALEPAARFGARGYARTFRLRWTMSRRGGCRQNSRNSEAALPGPLSSARREPVDAAPERHQIDLAILVGAERRDLAELAVGIERRFPLPVLPDSIGAPAKAADDRGAVVGVEVDAL